MKAEEATSAPSETKDLNAQQYVGMDWSEKANNVTLEEISMALILKWMLQDVTRNAKSFLDFNVHKMMIIHGAHAGQHVEMEKSLKELKNVM